MKLRDIGEPILIAAGVAIAYILFMKLVEAYAEDAGNKVTDGVSTGISNLFQGIQSGVTQKWNDAATQAKSMANDASRASIDQAQGAIMSVPKGILQAIWDGPVGVYDKLANLFFGVPVQARDDAMAQGQPLSDFEAGNMLVPIPGDTDFAPINDPSQTGGNIWATGNL